MVGSHTRLIMRFIANSDAIYIQLSPSTPHLVLFEPSPYSQQRQAGECLCCYQNIWMSSTRHFQQAIEFFPDSLCNPFFLCILPHLLGIYHLGWWAWNAWRKVLRHQCFFMISKSFEYQSMPFLHFDWLELRTTLHWVPPRPHQLGTANYFRATCLLGFPPRRFSWFIAFCLHLFFHNGQSWTSERCLKISVRLTFCCSLLTGTFFLEESLGTRHVSWRYLFRAWRSWG